MIDEIDGRPGTIKAFYCKACNKKMTANDFDYELCNTCYGEAVNIFPTDADRSVDKLAEESEVEDIVKGKVSY